MQCAIGFGVASHWLKYWHKMFNPITKSSDQNSIIIFRSHLKTAILDTNNSSHTQLETTPSQDCSLAFITNTTTLIIKTTLKIIIDN